MLIQLMKISFICIWCVFALDRSPYDVLGVGRTATTDEIKKAFKQLAREWHPDKNKSPQAEGKFIEVSQAYELLMDAERRSNFDRYGSFDDSRVNQQNQRRQQGFHSYDDFNHFFHSSVFDDFFQMPEPSEIYKRHNINYRQYDNELQQNSWEKPYLIFVYSDMCRSCKRYESIWEKVVGDLESVGYGVATVNNANQNQLVRRLQVRYLPTIIVLVQGRTHLFKEDINAINIVKFAKKSLPQHIVQPITDPNIDGFLFSWRQNKVPVLMFGGLDNARLRFMVLALEYQHFCVFGYVNLHRNARDIRNRFGVKNNGSEILLIFNEHVQQRNDPAASFYQSKELSMAAIRQAIDNHKFLSLPRISSQHHFDALCPPDNNRVSVVGRYICLILLAKSSTTTLNVPSIFEDLPDKHHIDAFRNLSEQSSSLFTTADLERLSISYMYTNKQSVFFGQLESSSERTNSSYRDVIIVSRLDAKQVRYRFVRGGWSGDFKLTDHSTRTLVEDVKKYLKRSDLLDKSTLIVDQLHNENGPSLYWQFCYWAMRQYESWVYWLEKEEMVSVISVLGTFGCLLLLSMCFNAVARTEAEQRAAKETRRRNNPPNEKFNLLC